jgi:hypothetical protein
LRLEPTFLTAFFTAAARSFGLLRRIADLIVLPRQLRERGPGCGRDSIFFAAFAILQYLRCVTAMLYKDDGSNFRYWPVSRPQWPSLKMGVACFEPSPDPAAIQL